MTVLDVSGIDFGRTKEISEVRGTSLKFNLDVRWQSQGVIYAVRPLNGSPVLKCTCMYLHTKLYCFISLIQSPKNLHHEENSLIIPRHMIFHGVTLYWPVLIPSFMFLTLKVPSKIYSRRHSKCFFFLLFFWENKSWHFMWIVCYDTLTLSWVLFFILFWLFSHWSVASLKACDTDSVTACAYNCTKAALQYLQ